MPTCPLNSNSQLPSYLGMNLVDWNFIGPLRQDLKGKILLKAKKIGGLEESVNGIAEESLTGEVSDEDEAAEIDEDNLHRESVRRRVKVGRVVFNARLCNFLASAPLCTAQ